MGEGRVRRIGPGRSGTVPRARKSVYADAMIRPIRLALVLALALAPIAPVVAAAADSPGGSGGQAVNGGPLLNGGPADDPAAQAAGLFMQSCVRFAANTKGLRAWAEGRHLARILPPHDEAFLYGLPGVAFDATTTAGKRIKLVLVSEDSGSCSVVVQHAKGESLLRRLDADLRAAGVAFKVTEDGPDAQEKDLHNRAYDASLGDRQWQMLVSTVSDPAGGMAMLTTNP